MSLSHIEEALLKQTEAQQKHSNFLMVSAGACIGFALTQSKDVSLGIELAALALALLLWALSFFLGCKYNDCTIASIRSNASYLDHELQGYAYGVDQFKVNTDKLFSKASASYRWQLRLLLGGVLSYVFWHAMTLFK